MKHGDCVNYLDQLKDYVQTSLSNTQNILKDEQNICEENEMEFGDDYDFSVSANVKLEENVDVCLDSYKTNMSLVKEEVSYEGKQVKSVQNI